VLRRILQAEREEVAGGWCRLHIEQIHDLCAAPNIIGVIRSRERRGILTTICPKT